MKLVSKLQLIDVEGGIADVAMFEGFAYLSAFSPECAGRPGAQGTGVHIVDVRDPRNPVKVGFISAYPNSFVGEGIHVVRASTPSFTGDILIDNNETCNATAFAPSGASLWNVTNPLSPQPLSRITRRTTRSSSSSVEFCRAARTGCSRSFRTTRI